jgi:hypothetical protein
LIHFARKKSIFFAIKLLFLSFLGALPLHWITHNQYCNSEMINYLINANPKGIFSPILDFLFFSCFVLCFVIFLFLLTSSSIYCLFPGPWVADCDGYLPLHWAVNQDTPNIGTF